MAAMPGKRYGFQVWGLRCGAHGVGATLFDIEKRHERVLVRIVGLVQPWYEPREEERERFRYPKQP